MLCHRSSVGQEMVGLVVDELLGQQEVVIKTLDSNLASSPASPAPPSWATGSCPSYVAGLLQGKRPPYRAKAQ